MNFYISHKISIKTFLKFFINKYLRAPFNWTIFFYIVYSTIIFTSKVFL